MEAVDLAVHEHLWVVHLGDGDKEIDDLIVVAHEGVLLGGGADVGVDALAHRGDGLEALVEGFRELVVEVG
jgi:hypothetical protein